MTLVSLEESTGELLSVPDTDSWTYVVAEVAKLAQHIAGTEFVPKGLRDNAPAVVAAILYGREVGLPPMTALRDIYVTNGRPAMYAEAMRGLVLAAGHDIEVMESTGAVCTMRSRRRGRDRWSAPVTWNLDMARAAGLLPAKSESGWSRYPRQMLVARATAELCRRDFPDVIHGMSTVEEVDDGPQTAEAEATKTRRTRVSRARPSTTPSPAAEKVEATPEPPPPPKDAGPGPVTPRTPSPDPAPPVLPPAPKGRTSETAAGDDPQISLDQRAKIMAEFNRLGVRDRATRIDYTSALIERKVDTTNMLTRSEASRLIDTLTLTGSSTDLELVVSAAREGDSFLPMGEGEE